MSISGFFNRAADFYAIDMSAQDAVGGIVKTEAVAHGNVRCCISTVSNTERGMFESRGVAATHWLFCSARYRDWINETYKVKSTLRGVRHDYHITSIEDPQSRGQHLKILLEELKDGVAER